MTCRDRWQQHLLKMNRTSETTMDDDENVSAFYNDVKSNDIPYEFEDDDDVRDDEQHDAGMTDNPPLVLEVGDDDDDEMLVDEPRIDDSPQSNRDNDSDIEVISIADDDDDDDEIDAETRPQSSLQPRMKEEVEQNHHMTIEDEADGRDAIRTERDLKLTLSDISQPPDRLSGENDGRLSPCSPNFERSDNERGVGNSNVRDPLPTAGAEQESNTRSNNDSTNNLEQCTNETTPATYQSDQANDEIVDRSTDESHLETVWTEISRSIAKEDEDPSPQPPYELVDANRDPKPINPTKSTTGSGVLDLTGNDGDPKSDSPSNIVSSATSTNSSVVGNKMNDSSAPHGTLTSISSVAPDSAIVSAQHVILSSRESSGDAEAATEPEESRCAPSNEQDSENGPKTTIPNEPGGAPTVAQTVTPTPESSPMPPVAIKYNKNLYRLEVIDDSPGANEGPNVVSILEFNGSTLRNDLVIDEANFRPVPVSLGWTRIPETKTRNLVPKRSKRKLREIEFHNHAWQIENDLLIISPEFKKRLLEKSTTFDGTDEHANKLFGPEAYKTILLDTTEFFEECRVTAAHQDAVVDKSRRATRTTRSRTQQQQPQASKKATTRVGDKYQAVILDHPSTYDRSRDTTNYTEGEVLWDPVQADAAAERGEPISEFLERKDLELNVKYLLMGSLHQSNYDAKEAMKLFIKMYQNEQKRLIEFNPSEYKLFNEVIAPRMLATKKDFVGAAKMMNRTKETVLVHYYLWKRQQRDYQRIKRDRKKEPDYCHVCEDGGTLIVCELCRKAFHLKCCSPPLERIPEGDWYCMPCVHASPARLRRLSTPQQTGFRGQQGATSAQRSLSPTFESKNLSPYEFRRRALRSVHKELFSPSSKSTTIHQGTTGGGGNNNNAKTTSATKFAPSGMVWDPILSVWMPCERKQKHRKAIADITAPISSPVSSKVSKDEWSDPEMNSNYSPLAIEDIDIKSDSSHISISSDGEYKQSDGDDDDDDDYSSDDYISERVNGKVVKKSKSKVKAVVYKPGTTETKAVPKQEGKVLYYDTQVPITSEGLLIHITGISGGGACFSGYRKYSNGTVGPAEQLRCFRAIGDKFILIDGKACSGKPFAEIRSLLKEVWNGQKCKYIRMSHTVAGTAGGAGGDSTRTVPTPHQQQPTTSQQSNNTNAGHKNNATTNGVNPSNTMVNRIPPHVQHQQPTVLNRPVPRPQPVAQPPPIARPAPPSNMNQHQQQRYAQHQQQLLQQQQLNQQQLQQQQLKQQQLQQQQLQQQQLLKQQQQLQLQQQQLQLQQQQQQRLQQQQQQQQQQASVAKVAAQNVDYHELQRFRNALAPLGIPHLIVFLNNRNIYDARTFLESNASMLATQWSDEQGISWDVALDFMGAARLQVRQYIASGAP